jgi:hypothetical protein
VPSQADTHDPPGTNPYVFVVGCPRSGTTLLQRMLDSHSLLAVANDSHFIPRAVEHVPLGVDPPLTADLVDWVRGYRRFHRLGLGEDTVRAAAATSRSYAQFVGALYTEYAHQRGKELAGEKTPDYVRHLPRLHALFPSVRSIHIIRDGREVALSALEWAHDGKGPSKLALWQDDPVAVCALWWRWQVSTGRSDGHTLGPDRYRETHYEVLVARPSETLRELAEFIGLPDDVQMANFYAGKTVHRPGLSAKKSWLPPTKGLRDWRTGMHPRDLATFEALAGDLLSELGYERRVSTFSSEVRERADRARAWWSSERSRRDSRSAGAR